MDEPQGTVFKRVQHRIGAFFKRNGFFRSFLAVAGIFTVGLLIASGIFIFLVWSGFFGPMPDRSHLEEIHHPIASEVYSVDSVLLGRYYLQDRSPVEAQDIPENLKQALVSTEDVRFY